MCVLLYVYPAITLLTPWRSAKGARLDERPIRGLYDFVVGREREASIDGKCN